MYVSTSCVSWAQPCITRTSSTPTTNTRTRPKEEAAACTYLSGPGGGVAPGAGTARSGRLSPRLQVRGRSPFGISLAHPAWPRGVMRSPSLISPSYGATSPRQGAVVAGFRMLVRIGSGSSRYIANFMGKDVLASGSCKPPPSRGGSGVDRVVQFLSRKYLYRVTGRVLPPITHRHAAFKGHNTTGSRTRRASARPRRHTLMGLGAGSHRRRHDTLVGRVGRRDADRPSTWCYGSQW